MKLQTQVPLVKAKNQIDYDSQLLLLGSCFVENIGDKLSYFKFQSVQNPFGILFHPLAIENLVSRAIHQEKYTEEEVFFLNERWHCFDAHSDLSSNSKQELLENLNTSLENTCDQIKRASHLIITLGTAWVYELRKSGLEVANCHKVPQKEFTKKVLPVERIVESLHNTINLIWSSNKNVQIVFTISPVRHLKDGFVENQQGKAHLITAIHQAINSSSFGGDWGADYFPSYEIMMDELRDYRFYAEDMVHPNNLAIEYIWEKFADTWVSESANPIMAEIDAIQKGLHHRPFDSNAEQHKKFLNGIQRKIEYLQKSYPFMKF